MAARANSSCPLRDSSRLKARLESVDPDSELPWSEAFAELSTDSSDWQYVLMWKRSRGRKCTAAGQERWAAWRAAAGLCGTLSGWWRANAVRADVARLCSWWNRAWGQWNDLNSVEDELEVTKEPLKKEGRRKKLTTVQPCQADILKYNKSLIARSFLGPPPPIF